MSAALKLKNTTNATTQDSGASPREEKPLRVLVVDDDPVLLKIIRATLEKGGLDVATASKVADATGLLESGRIFDAIISDIHMPEGDGRNFLSWIRSRGITTPFFLMSGDHVVPESEYAALGSDGFLHKPFSVERLILKIVLLLGQTKA